MKIKDLQPNQTASLEKVEVVNTGEVKEFNKYGSAGKLRNLRIKDSSGEADLTMWNDDVDKFSQGDTLKLTDCWVKEWNGNIQLSSGKKGKVEKI